jgi:hypothetical protein
MITKLVEAATAAWAAGPLQQDWQAKATAERHLEHLCSHAELGRCW